MVLFAKLIFFPAENFLLRKISLFQKTKKVLAGKKINLAKKVGPKRNISEVVEEPH
jgi:hypothetical protein